MVQYRSILLRVAGCTWFVLPIAIGILSCAATSQPQANTPEPPSSSRRTPSEPDPCDYPKSEEALSTCERTEYQRAETSIAGLVSALQDLYADDPELLSTFDTAQAKWREYRDAECAHRTYDSRGGTAFESYWLECLRMLDRERVQRLEYLKESP